MSHSATHCNTLQHTATHCNTLQHTLVLKLLLTWVMQHTATRCHTLQHAAILLDFSHTHSWVMSRIWMCHATRTTRLCHAYDWVMPHTWLSYVAHMTKSYDRVMSHIKQLESQLHTKAARCLSLVTHTIESCHTYECVMTHIQLSHDTHMTESRHTLNYSRPSPVFKLLVDWV